MPLFADPLDRLLSNAMASERRRKFKKLPSAKPPSAKTLTLRESFANPANWTPFSPQAIALIHRSGGTLTLLGAFRERRHLRLDIRELTRTEEPLAMSHQEFVTGPYWLNPRPYDGQIAPDPEIHTQRELVIDLVFPELSLSSEKVSVVVHLESGWMRAVCLANRTLFQSPDGRIHTWFPAQLDVLDVMSFESKVALKNLLRGE